MTPAARISAAIEILDTVLGGASAERALTNWARGNRFAGSKDRAAIRDHVFDALRCRRSYLWLGNRSEDAPSGRALLLGSLRAKGVAPETLFTGERFAPVSLSGAELSEPSLEDAPRGVRLDCPDWLLPLYDAALGEDCEAILDRCRSRSGVHLRVNLAKTDVAGAIASLTRDEIEVAPHPLSETALAVTKGQRAVGRSQAYLTGLVELQDAGSQSIVDAVPLRDGMSVLDFCAGGGGKSLAMAAKADLEIWAHDADPARMQDIAPRAARAGVRIKTLPKVPSNRDYDVVLCDVPCSGSGSWARAPQAKWALTPERLEELCGIQARILRETASHVKKGGALVYATCSLFDRENVDQINAFLASHNGFALETSRLISPLHDSDGFYVAVLRRGS